MNCNKTFLLSKKKKKLFLSESRIHNNIVWLITNINTGHVSLKIKYGIIIDFFYEVPNKFFNFLNNSII